MRLSTNTIYEQSLTAVIQQQESLLKVQQQVANGKRMQTPADDPVAAARALDVTQAAAINTQYAENRISVKNGLGLTDAILQNVTQVIQDAKTAAINAGDLSLTDSDRRSIAAELRSRFDHLLGLANTTDSSGRYLFSGYQGSARPFAPTATGVQYLGDQGQRSIQVTATRQIALTDYGADVFERIRNGNGVFVTAPAATNSGDGVVTAGTVVNPASLTGHDYQLNFTVAAAGAATAGTAIGPGAVPFTPNAATVATIAANTMYLRIGSGPSAGPTISIGAIALPGGGGNTNAASIAAAFDAAYVLAGGIPGTFTAVGGVVTKAAGANTVTFGIDGTAVNAAAVLATQTALISQTGLSAAQLGTQAYAAVNTYDVVDNSTIPVPTTLSTGNAYTSGSAISFDGLQFDIQGNPANGDSFTVKPSTNQSLFTTIDNLIKVLGSSVMIPSDRGKLTNGLNTAMGNLDNSLDRVLTMRTSIGTRMQEIDSLDSMGEDQDQQYQQILAQLQDVDYARAISDLNRQQVYLEAAQKAFQKVSGLSLFNYI